MMISRPAMVADRVESLQQKPGQISFVALIILVVRDAVQS